MSSVPGKILILIIDVYRYALSPLMSALGGSCRFAPSCSEYAREAVLRHGALAGLRLAAIRLLKCHPLHPGGHDPVPGTSPGPEPEKSA